MIKKAVLTVAVLSVLATFFYYYLGGGEPLKFELVPQPNLAIAGTEFIGKYNDAKMKDLFFKAKDAAEQNPHYYASVVYYRTQVSGGSVRQFIGISPVRTLQEDIFFREVRKFDQEQMVVTTINAHNFVMPRPDRVREEAQEFADQQGIHLDSLSIEIYKGDRELQVLFPVISE